MFGLGGREAQKNRITDPGRSLRENAQIRQTFRVIWWFLLLGFFLVALAGMFEHSYLFGTEHGSVVWAQKSFVSLLKEIGFALIIAWGIAYLIDSQAKQRDAAEQAALRESMAKDVISAVYGLQHDASYVSKVIEKALDSKVVRDFYDVSYTIFPLSPDEESFLNVAPGRFVKLHSVTRYALKNISPALIDYQFSYSIPARSAPKLRAFAGIKQMKISGKSLTEKEIEEALEPFDDESDEKLYQWTKPIPARNQIDFVVETIIVKELSDSEVWGSFHATYGGMNMNVRVPSGMHFGVRHLTATPAVKDYKSDGAGAWKIDGPILPNDSVVFWWRSPEDDGESSGGATEEPVEGSLC